MRISFICKDLWRFLSVKVQRIFGWGTKVFGQGTMIFRLKYKEFSVEVQRFSVKVQWFFLPERRGGDVRAEGVSWIFELKYGEISLGVQSVSQNQSRAFSRSKNHLRHHPNISKKIGLRIGGRLWCGGQRHRSVMLRISRECLPTIDCARKRPPSHL